MGVVFLVIVVPLLHCCCKVHISPPRPCNHTIPPIVATKYHYKHQDELLETVQRLSSNECLLDDSL
jgi:hypothetical protein